MAEIRYEHPLKLPSGWSSTPASARGYHPNFSRNMRMEEAFRYLEDEINAYDFSAATIFSNFQHANNERLRKKIGNDSGISVIIKIGGRTHHLACDHWIMAEHNAYAIHLALRAMRNLEEWGIATKQYALSLFSGELSGGSSTSSSSSESGTLPEWMSALGLGPTATLEDANATYRRRAKDLADQEEELITLNQAIDEARKSLS